MPGTPDAWAYAMPTGTSMVVMTRPATRSCRSQRASYWRIVFSPGSQRIQPVSFTCAIAIRCKRPLRGRTRATQARLFSVLAFWANPQSWVDLGGILLIPRAIAPVSGLAPDLKMSTTDKSTTGTCVLGSTLPVSAALTGTWASGDFLSNVLGVIIPALMTLASGSKLGPYGHFYFGKQGDTESLLLEPLDAKFSYKNPQRKKT